MPTYSELADELRKDGITHDGLRRKYLKNLHDVSKRNVITYYSGWLQKPGLPVPDNLFAVDDLDKNGFMTAIHAMDRKLGLDLLLHTPGGSAAATESLVDYLHSMFQSDIRVIVPQLAMSAGTMIACAAREIIMGKQSSLGPIDPQYGGLPAHGIIEEFQDARKDMMSNSGSHFIWQPIIAKYHPTLIGECQKAIQWSKNLVGEWLEKVMFKDIKDDKVRKDRIKKIVEELGDHQVTLSHDRHISIQKALDIGLNVIPLETAEPKDKFQDAVLSVHHANMLTLMETNAAKIIENHLGKATILQLQVTRTK